MTWQHTSSLYKCPGVRFRHVIYPTLTPNPSTYHLHPHTKPSHTNTNHKPTRHHIPTPTTTPSHHHIPTPITYQTTPQLELSTCLGTPQHPNFSCEQTWVIFPMRPTSCLTLYRRPSASDGHGMVYILTCPT